MVNFIDNDHKSFFYSKLNKLQVLGKTDVYYLSLVYTLSICETTREHFSSIFNIEKGEINLDAIKAGWQTGTSEKVTRMAFNLWNHSIMFDSEEDFANDKISCCYAPSEIFCCSYAPYFWEAVQIRYPEYTKVLKNEKMVIDKEHKENENEYVCEIE